MALEIIAGGLLTTIQDRGRLGHTARGFQVSGACDKYSMRLANLLAGNQENPDRAAVLEFTMKGACIRFTSREVIALAGADMVPALNGRPVPMYRPFLADRGDELTLGMARQGMRGYMALYGGIDVPLVMGSRSTNLKCRLGGLEGRALRRGDLLHSGADAEDVRLLMSRLKGHEAAWEVTEEEPWLRLPGSFCRYRDGKRLAVLRAVPGPQEDAFTDRGMESFVTSTYTLTRDCDRMACRLEGQAIETKNGADILSDGIVEGSVQINARGLPMVMLADHQTTGGYAKIGTVISTDIPALAQLGPGGQAIFEFVTPGQAVAACRKEAGKLAWLKERMCGALPGVPGRRRDS